MGLIVLSVALLLFFELAVWRWAADSSEDADSPEWERRRAWRGYHRV
jgi:hypothetical protein